jgi:hypothetical protein
MAPRTQTAADSNRVITNLCMEVMPKKRLDLRAIGPEMVLEEARKAVASGSSEKELLSSRKLSNMGPLFSLNEPILSRGRPQAYLPNVDLNILAGLNMQFQTAIRPQTNEPAFKLIFVG